jgi:hypothetical protein
MDLILDWPCHSLLLLKPKATTPGLTTHQHYFSSKKKTGDNTGLAHHNTNKMPSLVDSIVEGFPFPTVNPIISEPNYESIAALHQQLNANAASVQSHLGNGVLRLLYLTVSPAVSANISAVSSLPPVNPGPTPIIPDRSTVPTTTTIRARFVEDTDIFKQYSTTDKALKQLLVGAADEMFIRSLQTKYLGYLNVSTRKILDHLYAQYARISASDL